MANLARIDQDENLTYTSYFLNKIQFLEEENRKINQKIDQLQINFQTLQHEIRQNFNGRIISKVMTLSDIKQYNWIKINDLSQLKWKDCAFWKLDNLLDFFRLCNDKGMLDLTLKRIERVKKLTASYRFKILVVIWEIVTLKFTFFKVEYMKIVLNTLYNKYLFLNESEMDMAYKRLHAM